MQSFLHLTILSPEHKIFEGDVDSVTFPGEKGAFTVLTRHAPIISSLLKGTITYKMGNNEESLLIESGFTEVKENRIVACVETE